MSTRQALIAHVAELILAAPIAARHPSPGVLRVGIDGVDGAGKSMFGDELTAYLAAAGRPIIRASVDGFHNPQATRYRQGRHSPAGFFYDSYDYVTLKTALLDPLSPEGDGCYRTAAFDHRADAPVNAPLEHATPGAILVFDGIFLHRPELRGYWDCSVFLQVDFGVSVGRIARRDGGSPDPQDAANRRYIDGQRLYISTCMPQRHATLVIDNTDLAAPYLCGGIDPAPARC